MYIALLVGIIVVASIAVMMIVNKQNSSHQSNQISADDFEIIETYK